MTRRERNTVLKPKIKTRFRERRGGQKRKEKKNKKTTKNGNRKQKQEKQYVKVVF